MQSRVVRGVLTVAFIGVIAAPLVVSGLVAQKKAQPTGDSAAAMRQYGFHLQEVSRQVGVDFVHVSPKLDPRLNPIMPQIASMGAGVAVADFDRDGWQDFYVTNSGETTPNRLYRNKGNGTFEDMAAAVGLAQVNSQESGVSMGAVWGDYDNDGYEDLFIYKWGRPELFRNDRGKKFTRVTETAGLPQWANANSALWLDYDRDGLLDLFLAGYYREDINLWRLRDTRIMPDSFEYATNGGRKYLFRNLGGGKFADVTEQVGIQSRRWTLAAGAADMRGTGYPDIVVANDYGVPEYFANEGGKRFQEIGKQTGIAARPKSGMNVSFGDVFNQGTLAFYISNITEPSKLNQLNNLWVPEAGKSGDRLRYREMATALGISDGGWSFGAQFGDLNNDGWQDLFLTNGYVSASRSADYWYSYSKITGATGAIIADAKNWPAMGDLSLAGYQQKRVWVSDQGAQFVDAAPALGVSETYDGRAVALADFSNRGVMDVLVANQKAPLLVYRNEVAPGRSWIAFELEGTKSNRSAIGAEVRVFWNGQQQLQVVSGGSGFCAQNQRRLHFGLGNPGAVDRVVIRWPSGKEQTISAPTVGQLHRVKEAV